MGAFRTLLWARLKEVGLPFFRSGQRRLAFLALALLIALLLTVNGLNVVNSYVGRDMMTALERRHIGWFYALAGMLAGVFAASTVVEVFAQYVEQRLGLFWRDWLTRRFLDRYLAHRAYRRLGEETHVDNPDQRISEDVRTFTASTLSFAILLFNAVVTFCAFAGVLWSITPWLFLASVVYAVIGSLGTILLGRRLVELNNLQLKKEADFRYGLGRVREHAGTVAQLGGEEEEKTRLGGRVAVLVANFRSIIVVSRNLSFFTTLYNYLPQIIPALLVAPLYVWGGFQFGAVTQAAMAFSQLLGAFSLIVTQFQNLSSYAAVVGRLGVLWEATEPVAAPGENQVRSEEGGVRREDKPARQLVPPPSSLLTPHLAPPGPAVEIIPDGRQLSYEGVTLWTPGEHRLLVCDLTLDVPEGKRLVVTGPSGSGKTALLLAAAGLWGAGQGRVVRPGPRDMRFVPQQPYTPSGCLRDVLLYGTGREGVPDERLLRVLHEVDTEGAIEGDLDAERDWSEVLSWGEQRTLAFARLLLTNPRFAFLDDTAEALEEARVERLYKALARSSITYISVGGGSALLPHHDLHLELQGDGGWRLEPAAQWQDGGSASSPGVRRNGVGSGKA